MSNKIKNVFVYLNVFIFLIVNISYSATIGNYDSPLFEAVKNMDLAKTREYINNGYAVNIKDTAGNTPLTYAIRNEDYDITISLLQGGADPSIIDETNYPIYCTGQVSGSNRIRLFFQNYDSTKCPKVVKKDIKKNNSSIFNWKTIGGTILTLGTIGGLVAAGSGSVDSGNDEVIVPDTPEGLLTTEQLIIYNDIISGINTINADYYSGYTFSTSIDGINSSNNDVFQSINLAYAWARGFDGSINSNSNLSSSDGYPEVFKDNIPTGTSSLSQGSNIQVAVVDTGVFPNNPFISNNLNTNVNGINQLYEYYNDNCNNNFCQIYNDSSNSVFVNCTASGTTLTCNLYSAASAGSIIADSTFTLNQGNATATNLNSIHGTLVSNLIVANPAQTSNNEYMGFAGIAPNAQVIPYLVATKFPINSADSTLFDFFVDYKYIGNAFTSAAQNNAVAINNSWGNTISWSNTGGNYYNVISNDQVTVYESSTGLTSNLSNNYLYYYYADTPVSGGYQSGTTYSTSNFLDSMKTAVNNGSIFVFAAGNEGQANPNLESLIPLYLTNTDNTKTFYDETNNMYENFITVVAYDTSTGSLMSDSNQCGIAQRYCLTAPGANITISNSITNDLIGTTFDNYTGTSFAAPIVSGAIALIKSAYPYLTGAEITKLLFITAKDLGAAGVDEVYGWGMIDLEAATRPYGLTTVPTTSSINENSTLSYSLSNSKIRLNSLIADTIKSKNLNLVVLDSFNRTFNVNLNNFIESEKDRVNTIDILNNFATKSNLIALNKDGNLNLYYTQGQNKVKNSLSQEIELSYSVDNDTINDNNYGFNLYYGNNPYNAFIDNKVDFYNNFSLSNSYNYNALNPYFKTNSDKNFAFNNLFKLNDKTILNLGVVSQNYVIDYDKYYENRKETEELGNSLSFLAGLNYNINDNLSTKLDLGFINEYNTLFGSEWNGAFGLGGNNTTYFTSISSSLNILDNNKLSLVGKMNFGYTNVNSIENSLIKDISNLYTSSYAIGINYNFDSKLKDEKSNISFLISQPVNIQNGSLNISLPTSRDNDGNIYYTSHKINLDGKKETNYQLAYNYSLGEDISFNLGAIYRDYINNEAIFLLKYKKNF